MYTFNIFIICTFNILFNRSEFQAAWDSEMGEQVRQTLEKMKNTGPDSGSNNEPLDDPNLD